MTQGPRKCGFSMDFQGYIIGTNFSADFGDPGLIFNNKVSTREIVLAYFSMKTLVFIRSASLGHF